MKKTAKDRKWSGMRETARYKDALTLLRPNHHHNRAEFIEAIRGLQGRLIIDRMVYSGDIDQQEEITLNEQFLTEKHCRHLWPIFSNSSYSYSPYLYSLVKAPTYPSDLLLDLALDSKYSDLWPWVAKHPNITEEIQVVMALREMR